MKSSLLKSHWHKAETRAFGICDYWAETINKFCPTPLIYVWCVWGLARKNLCEPGAMADAWMAQINREVFWDTLNLVNLGKTYERHPWLRSHRVWCINVDVELDHSINTDETDSLDIHLSTILIYFMMLSKWVFI